MSLVRRFALLWPMLLAAGVPLHAQEQASETPPPQVALPPNVIVSSGPATGAPPPADHAQAVLPSGAAGEERLTPRFLGAMNCSSSLCHGGGSPERNAYTIWAKSDPHRRAPATLAGARAERIAAGLSLGPAAASARCTECHSPLAAVPTERLSVGVDPQAEGVSCESCHGPAQNWVRSHTRHDFTHAQNVQTGVREERSLYARANTCVACHQVLAPDVLAAGHPALFFELDAQIVAEPRHWLDRGDFFGPQAWLTGQAAALRELSWALGQITQPPPEMREQWRALLWLLRRTAGALERGDEIVISDEFTPANVATVQTAADTLARAASSLTWTRERTRRCLADLSALDQEFLPSSGESSLVTRSRAERLVPALARLLAALQKQEADKWTTASQELDKLSVVAGTEKGFDGAAFGEQLRRLHAAVLAVYRGPG